MVTHGMNVEEVKHLGQVLQQKAADIQAIISEINGKVNGTTWMGPDAQAFKEQWWPEHQQHLKAVSDQIQGFGQSALNNASEQESVSQVR
jgi:uncharacterized protein YukE